MGVFTDLSFLPYPLAGFDLGGSNGTLLKYQLRPQQYGAPTTLCLGLGSR